MSEQHIVDASDLRKYRTELPNLYDDADLDVYEFRLLAYYKRVGICWESLETTAAKCHMSTGQASQKRRSLAEKGWVTLEPIDTPSGPGFRVHIVDVWATNFETYAGRRKPSHHEGSIDEPSPHEAMPSPHETEPSCGEVKKEPIKNQPNKSLAVAPQAPTQLPLADKVTPTQGKSKRKPKPEDSPEVKALKAALRPVVCEVTGTDFHTAAASVNTVVSVLASAQPAYTPAEVKAFEAVWFTNGFNKRDGTRPTVWQLRDRIGVVRSNKKAPEPAAEFARKAAAATAGYRRAGQNTP